MALFRLSGGRHRPTLRPPVGYRVEIAAVELFYEIFISSTKYGPIKPSALLAQLPSVQFIQGRVGDATTLHAVLQELGDKKADVVLSDMAPACTGIRREDHFNSVELCLYAADLMEQVRSG